MFRLPAWLNRALTSPRAGLQDMGAHRRASPHICHLQAQFAKAGEQGKEFYELAAKLTQQTFATLNSTAMKSIAQLAA